MTESALPMPPHEFRYLVGCSEADEYENPTGQPLFAEDVVPLEAYRNVFDFGCGCGRHARKLLLQNSKPESYVGIDTHPGLVDWCNQNLSAVNSTFEFHHHDVYSPTYAPNNALCLGQPLPAADSAFSLILVNSVFTHLTREQVEFYLAELSRILSPGGVAFTSWFFFDNDSFPFLEETPVCLYTNESNFTEAVIFDRVWFLNLVRKLNLRVRHTRPPATPGYQWHVYLEKRTAGATDEFPLGEDAAEWVCGATVKPIANLDGKKKEAAPNNPEVPADTTAATTPDPPPLRGPLAKLDDALKELDAVRKSMTWKAGCVVTAPVKLLRKLWS